MALWIYIYIFIHLICLSFCVYINVILLDRNKQEELGHKQKIKLAAAEMLLRSNK